ncbi:MAG: radical SAM protein [Anaerolineales bacterium]|nr:radical SAM protein [Anaerolineales bacterium]MDW8447887.1 radical SAM protein [Anaerolineales bacterium]
MNGNSKPERTVKDGVPVIIPEAVAKRYGWQGGEVIRIQETGEHLEVLPPITHLRKIYVEATNLCNLACVMCMRKVWDESAGYMDESVFQRILEGIEALSPAPTVFFGGFGEPLAHPHIVEMVTSAKKAGATVELITNATLLSPERSQQLISAGLDKLWISLDGIRPESYADIRLGAELPKVLANIEAFQRLRPPAHLPHPQIGIVFVAMRRNLSDLPELYRWRKRLGVQHVLVTNVLPYTVEMVRESLYARALHEPLYIASHWVPLLDFPRIQFDALTVEPFIETLRSGFNASWGGVNLSSANDCCPFIQRGSVSIAWHGGVSPCLPLLHDHTSYLAEDRPRYSKAYFVGSLKDRSLSELWGDAEYVAFRGKVQRFDFAPCATCGGCDLSLENQADCYGNAFPTCGGCLYAQGIVRCP